MQEGRMNEGEEAYGAQARRRRIEMRLSLQAVAGELGCGISRYARVESGAVEPTPDERRAINRLLGFGGDTR